MVQGVPFRLSFTNILFFIVSFVVSSLAMTAIRVIEAYRGNLLALTLVLTPLPILLCKKAALRYNSYGSIPMEHLLGFTLCAPLTYAVFGGIGSLVYVAGALLNIVALGFNDWLMPVLVDPFHESTASYMRSISSTHCYLNEQTRLPWLCDVLGGQSIGDMLISIGNALIIFDYLT